MSKRKLIGLITSMPESIYTQRSLDGIFTQCDKYGYDVAVFTSLIHISSYHKDYLKGELNIFELINFDMLDGVIVDTIPLTEDHLTYVTDYICDKLKRECTKPVVSLNVGLADYPVVKSDDSDIFREITRHVLEDHKCKNIYFLTGMKDYSISQERLAPCLETMREHGLTVSEDRIFYGDFWYSGGAALADKILSGEVAMPEAVISVSDHMAIGLANRLAEGGVKIPQDIIITGFDATQEAALNDIPITSFEANVAKSAADAVDYLRTVLEPGAELDPLEAPAGSHIHTGASCGCRMDVAHSTKMFKDSFFFVYRDYTKEGDYDNLNIGELMENYVSEQLSGANTPQECLKNIYLNSYFLRPYDKFYLCLKEDWLDPDSVITSGYPEKMKTVVHATPVNDTGFYEDDKSELFSTKRMLPQMFEEHEKPAVFYFAPVHFKDKTLGYAVLQCSPAQKHKIGLVFRYWLREVNNSLEMIQVKNRLMTLSIHDEMTGAYNRRGMNVIVSELLSKAKPDDLLFSFVIDMDGLKYINDTFGHSDGDFSIKLVHSAAASIMRANDICIRAGGDEFFVIGVSSCTENQLKERMLEFYDQIDTASKASGKPYTISASIGFACSPISHGTQINSIINAADVDMYKNKVSRKKQRS